MRQICQWAQVPDDSSLGNSIGHDFPSLPAVFLLNSKTAMSQSENLRFMGELYKEKDSLGYFSGGNCVG
jgi:hypothetical protein